MDNVCNRRLFSIPSKVEMAEKQEYSMHVYQEAIAVLNLSSHLVKPRSYLKTDKIKSSNSLWPPFPRSSYTPKILAPKLYCKLRYWFCIVGFVASRLHIRSTCCLRMVWTHKTNKSKMWRISNPSFCQFCWRASLWDVYAKKHTWSSHKPLPATSRMLPCTQVPHSKFQISSSICLIISFAEGMFCFSFSKLSCNVLDADKK